jgi:transposase
VTPTREEIRQAYDSGYEAVVTLFEGTCKELEERVMELERRLNQNSQNSHKPPSSDGLKRVPPRSQRKKTGRRSGGQVGHDGTRLEMVGADEVNEIVRHWPETCSGCGARLEARGSNPEGDEGQEGEGYTRRQVHDIPVIEIEVREHRAMEVRCGCCGAISVGSYPEGVEHEVQYGSGIKAWLTYASVYQLLPMERNTEMLADITGRRVSEGTLANALATCAKQVAPIEAKIKAAVIASEVIHVDETGIRMGQESHWLHVSSTPTLTHYDVDKQRGADAHERIGILPNFSGVAVHDRYKSFNKAPDSVLHSYCNAHILRDLTAIEELTHQSWPGKMKSVLLDMKAQFSPRRAGAHGRSDGRA